jgi:hypothetical protein
MVDSNNTMASTTGVNTDPGSRTRSRSPATTSDEREKSTSVVTENNSVNTAFTSKAQMDDAAEHVRMRHSLSLINDEEQEAKEHEDIPITASRVTELHLDQERYENDSYFDDHHYQTGTNGMLSPESQGTEEDDFIKRIYESTVDGACQGVLPVCNMSIDEQLDLFTHCRQPLAFLSLFREHGDTRDGVEALPAGMGMCKFCRAVHLIPSNNALTSSSTVHTFRLRLWLSETL